MVTLDVKQVLIWLVLLALFVLLVFLIVLVKNLIPSLKKLDGVMEDAKRITTVAASKTEQIDGVIDNASSTIVNVARDIKGNNGLIGRATNIGAGLASAKAIATKFVNDDDKEYLKRARERKADRSKS